MVAWPHVGHGRADLSHDARRLVTQDRWYSEIELAFRTRQVAMADAAGLRLDSDLERSRGIDLEIFENERASK